MKDLEAEAVRQSHCDRKHMAHLCQGVVTISQQGLQLDCRICGVNTETLEGISSLLETARGLCRIVGVTYESLTQQQRRELLLECVSMIDS